ncbi:hypothetical protein C0995_007720 [Termitomyces sp. Mi166|nr:hypothetical protein C0995_007720 [Termitomyces sp. Mi166\
MHRFSSLMKSPSSPSRNKSHVAPAAILEDTKTLAATVSDDEDLPLPSLQFKRVDHYYSRWSKSWKYRNMSSKVTVEGIPLLHSGNNDPWKDYSFVLVRKIPKTEYREPTFKIVVKSGYILKACQDMFITFFDKFVEYRDGLVSKKPKTERDTHVISSVNLLLSTISTDYRTTLSTIDRLTSHGEITFELLYALLIPRTLFFATCAITGNPRLFKLKGFDHDPSSLVKGAIKIQELDAYPLKYHPEPDKLRAALLKRGKKWVGLNGVHHMQYTGIAAFKREFKVIKHNFPLEYITPTMSNVPAVPPESSTDSLVLSVPPHGLEFDVEEVRPVEWNKDAFANLVLPLNRKDLLRSLVEAHHRELGFDDFIKGKGHGLVINLFGPPGVGKTFSAEATSEHVKRPLYVVGGGDLGTRAADMDVILERIFSVATAWKAIVLIDEFSGRRLEQRSLHDLERNAMVAVFLCHVEYYRGILFLTTNRVQAFDEAFLSRIHVALHFYELSQTSKEQVWTAFIGKLRVQHSITPEQIKELATRNINGRQIKNAVRTAQLAAERELNIVISWRRWMQWMSLRMSLRSSSHYDSTLFGV